MILIRASMDFELSELRSDVLMSEALRASGLLVDGGGGS